MTQGLESEQWTGQVLLWPRELPTLTRKRALCPSHLQEITSCSHQFLFQAVADEAVLEAAQKALVVGLGMSVGCGGAGPELSLEWKGWGGVSNGRGGSGSCSGQGQCDPGRPGCLPRAPREVAPHLHLALVSHSEDGVQGPAPKEVASVCVCAHVCVCCVGTGVGPECGRSRCALGQAHS